MIYYYNGHYTRDTPHISAADRGFTLGDGCFTTLKIQNGQAEYALDHLNRLQNHLDILYIPLSLDHNIYVNIIAKMMHMADTKNGIMRITISRGVQEKRGLAAAPDCRPNILITLTPAPKTQTKLTACISPIKRNPTSPLSRIKSTSSYLDNILSLKHAEEQGCNEALLLNIYNEACCFTIGNLLIETQDNKWLTPPPEAGCIQGITLKYLPYDIHYAPITLDMLKNAKAIYRTNSVSGMVKVEMKLQN